MTWAQTLTLVGVLAGLALGLYAINHLRSRIPQISSSWADGTLPIVLGMLLIHWGLWEIVPNFWLSLYQRKGFLIFQLMIGLGARIATDNKKSVRIVGKMLALVGFVGFCVNIWSAHKVVSETEKIVSLSSPEILAVRQVSNPANPIPALGVNKDLKAVTEEFWRDKLPRFTAQAMIKIAEDKTAFNQFEKDGKNPYRGRKNWKDIGIMAINEDKWLEKSKALGFNIYTLQGNLDMAAWMFDNYGFDPWKEASEVQEPPKSQPSQIVLSTGKLPYSSYAGEDPSMRALVDEFWRHGTDLNLEPAEKMVAVCRCESHFRQFESDGVTPYHVRDDPDTPEDESKLNVIGLMMINIDAWKDKIDLSPGSQFDPRTTMGNLRAAAQILKLAGMDAWECYKKKKIDTSHIASVVAPLQGWSEKLYFSGPGLFDTEGLVNVRVNGSYTITHNRRDTVPFDEPISFVECRSLGSEASKCTYFVQ